MNQKVVLITGASSGIGMETALLLLSQGYTVYAGARRLASMQKLQAKSLTSTIMFLKRYVLI